MPPLRRVLQNRCTVRSLPPGPAQRAMPRIVTRPVIDIIASVIRRSWRSVVGSRHWLKQAKTVIISGMGGGSSCKVGLGNPYSTRCCRSTHLHFYTVLSHPISSPFLAKVLLISLFYYLIPTFAQSVFRFVLVSLSRLNHWLPRAQTHPEIMQGTAEFHHQVTDVLLPQANAVFDDPTAL